MKKCLLLSCVSLLLLASPALAQQTGTLQGTVTAPGGDALPGVTITASSPVLPKARVVVTGGNGGYRIPLLPPGKYQVDYTLSGLTTEKRSLDLHLDETATVDVAMRPETFEESVDVVAQPSAIDVTSSEIKSYIGDETINKVPVGQDFRDLQKLIPGVQYTQDRVTGASAGGSGQDNVYLFDGVDVSLPLFGNLSAEPASHDIDQISVIKGGAKAVDFNRSGGFTMDTVSKAGTNQFKGEVSYQVQTESMTATRKTTSASEFDRDQDWTVASVGGPILRDQLYFYASYFRPTEAETNGSNVYGDVADFDDTRDEYFGKLSYTPTESIWLNGSYRDSDHVISHRGVDSLEASSTSAGDDSTLKIGNAEGGWILTDASSLSFKVSSFENDNLTRPDNLFDFPVRADGSVRLDVANLDQQGYFVVPKPIAGDDAFNDFIAPLIDRYGYLQNGQRLGGGAVGGYFQVDDSNYTRDAYKAAYDHALYGSGMSHDLHVGYTRSKDEEELLRRSNGWGVITAVGGHDTTADGTPFYFQADVDQQSLLGAAGALVAPIRSQLESESFEINDTIRWGDWSFNLGVLASHDTYFGQGLRKNSANPSGFELAPGHIYEMYDIGFDEMIQPRIGVVRSINGTDTVYANYARYYPEASSLPRAASWARNLRTTIEAHFDAQGNLIDIEPIESSSGKFFADDLDPRRVEEYLVGYSKQINNRWTGRIYARHRYGVNFWEDTNNSARIAFNAPDGIPHELYVPQLDGYRFGPGGIGGSSYVIAELDGAFTKYYEAGLETQWRSGNAYFQGSYVWSHYYGNFDQDNTTTGNDMNTFIGSSFLADGAGRQIWNNRYGDLRGDRRHQLKLYGYYQLDWNATVGAFGIYQSGQPWEIWSYEPYSNLTGSTSDVSRYAEPAGSHTTPDHYQLDLNYTQNFPLLSRYNVQLRVDVFNILDKQTGYNVQNQAHSGGFGTFRSFYDPRRFQLQAKFQF